MARPKVPLISRRQALEAALGIVDAEGLEALSMRRLGEALNVNGASLYHHFRNKDEILVGVTQLALADVTSPRDEHEGWRVWLPLNAYRTRDALVAHPELIPIMLRRVPLGIGTAEVEASVEKLRSEGVSLAAIAPLMESLELLAITSALQQVGSHGAGPSDESSSSFKAAQDARGLSNKELFEVMVSSIVTLVESAVQLKDARQATERPKSRKGSPGQRARKQKPAAS